MMGVSCSCYWPHESSRCYKSHLHLHNRQRTRPLDRRRFLNAAQTLLRNLLRREQFDLGIYFVAAPEMTRLNEQFLQHAGSTDVITFDYSDPGQPELLIGEIFICVDEAVTQARRYRATWQRELLRYLVHGVLHLSGYNDRSPAQRRRMRRTEDHFLRRLKS